MASFEFTSPDGKKYTVEGPDGATQEQAFQVLETQLGAKKRAADLVENDPITQGAKNFNKDASFLDNLNAGAGQAFSELGQGVGQKLGVVSNDDVKESRRLDAPLNKTVGGKVGNIGANVAMLAPAALIPGAATVPGAAIIGGVAGAVRPAASTGESFLNTGLGAAGGAGGQWVANKAAGSVAFQEGQNALKASQGAQKVDAAKKARDAGFVVPPEEMNPGTMTKVLTGAGGKIKTGQVFSEKNQQNATRLAREELQIPDGVPLNIDTLGTIRKQAGQAYENMRGAGTVASDAAFEKAVDGIATKYKTAVPSFPGLGKTNMHGQPVDEISDLVKAMKASKQFDASEAIDAIKLIRESADKAFIAGDKTLGKANKVAADELESLLGRHLETLGQPEALQAFQQARQTIAKTYTVQKALNPMTGDVSPAKLGNVLRKNAESPISGGLRDIAEANVAFPRATQSLKEAPTTWSPLDIAFAAKNIGTGNVKGIAADVATLGVRPAARSVLMSNLIQRKMIENAGTPEQVNRLARLLANREAMVPLGVAGGNALSQAINR